MLHIRSWEKHQNAVIAKAKWTRQDRVEKGKAPPESLTSALSIQSVSVACVLDENFAEFAERVGGSVAESYLLRTLQYVANGHALDGVVPVPREKFGAIVLSRHWHIVSRRIGETVYDALLASGIATIHEPSVGGSTGRSSGGTSGVPRARVPGLTRPGLTRPPPSVPLDDGGVPGEVPPPESDDPLDDAEAEGFAMLLAVMRGPKRAPEEQSLAATVGAAFKAGTLTPRAARKYLRACFADRDARCAYLATYNATKGRRSA